MPMAKEIPLYMGKSIGELNGFVDVTDPIKDPKRLCKSVDKIYKAADETRLLGDEEKSYVLYMRCFNAMKQIYSSSEFKKDKKYFENMVGTTRMKTACEWAEKLSSSLEKRYKLLKEEEEVKKILEAKSQEEALNKKNVKIETELPKSVVDVVGIEDVKLQVLKSLSDVPGSVSCKSLYKLLTENSTHVILMDTRTISDYAQSHINHSSTINIPTEIIKPGITAPNLDSLLPTASHYHWKMRAEAEFIILLDWFSSELKPPVGQELISLKNAIYKWDMKTVLKTEPLILEGGYDSWLTYYPSKTTNAHVTRPKASFAVDSELITLDFDYPEDLDKAFLASPSESLNGSDSNKDPDDLSLVQDKKPTTNITNNIKQLPSVNRATKPKSENIIMHVDSISDSSNVLHSPSISSKDTPTKFLPQPNINRDLKPFVENKTPKVVQQNYEDALNENKLIREMVSRSQKDVETSLNLEKELLEKEQEIHKVRLERERDAEEGMKLELQKKEIQLLERLRQMELQQNEMNAERSKMEEENEKLKQIMEERIKQKDEEFRKLKDELIMSQRKEEERKMLAKEVQRLRLERKRKEGFGHNSQTKQDNIPLPSQESPKAVSIAPSPGVKGMLTNFTKLKGDGPSDQKNLPFKGNLSRSQSFPNIAQQLDNEDPFVRNLSAGSKDLSTSVASRQERIKPLVNRDVKPSLVEIHAATNRNFMPVYGGQGQALTGLRNLGNTCYANAVIQCLANTMPLVKYFIDGIYRGDINRNNKSGHQGELVEEFAAVIRAIWTGQYRSLSPRDFIRVIGEYEKMFIGYEQHDSQEFLNILIDKLHEDLNKANQAKAKELQNEMQSLEDSNLDDSPLASKSWKIHKLLNNSIFVTLFQGQYKSRLKCLHCGKTSTTFDTFMFLSLPIPAGNQCSLKDCLKLYLQEEKLTGSSKWKCPRCKVSRETEKKIDIWKLPPILLILFKRFYYEGMWRRKLQTYIDFPSDNLDLTSYVKGPDNKAIFNLYAVTNHSGTLDGGHYTAVCKNAPHNRWFKFDDHNVVDMIPSDLKSSAAYILYYTSYSR